jgi:hypothetical protein
VAAALLAKHSGTRLIAPAALAVQRSRSRISGRRLVDRFAVPSVMCAAHWLALGGGC